MISIPGQPRWQFGTCSGGKGVELATAKRTAVGDRVGAGVNGRAAPIAHVGKV